MSIQELPDGGSSKPSKLARILAPWETLIYRGNRATALKWMNQAVRIARKPLALQAGAWSAWDAGIERVRSGGFRGDPASWLALQFIPTLSKSHETLMWRDLELRTMIVLIAAERSRLGTGHWPERLEEIEKAILPNAPIDPLSGKPILLLHRDGRLFAYSVSFNKKDDHAAFAPRPRSKGPYDFGWFAWDPDQRGLRVDSYDE